MAEAEPRRGTHDERDRFRAAGSGAAAGPGPANNASFGILITQVASGVVDDPRIVSLPLSTFLLLR